MLVPTDARRDAFKVDPRDGRSINVFDNDLLIKVSSRDTGNAFTIFEAKVEPLDGPPLHLHKTQDESWHILAGEFLFEVDGEEIYAYPGDTVFAPRGSRHTFQNVGATAGHLITTVVPGGLDLFFEEVAATIPQNAPPDPAKLVPLFEKYEMELLGPPLSVRAMTTAAGAD